VIAKVNGAEIRQSDLAVAEEELGPSLQQMDPATRRENLIAFLIDMKIVAKAAEAKKIGDTPDFKQKLAFARDRLLMDSLLATEGKAAVTDDAMKKVYEEATKQVAGEKEVRARHILVPTEEEAKAIKADLERAPTSPSSRRRSRRIRARPMAAISASSPRSRWCRNSPRSPSRSSRARFPIR
jgi:peptidyl-prolyl cis-trans isomerase C